MTGDRTALLLGGRGFIGAAVTAELIERGYQIACLEPAARTLGRLSPHADHVTLLNGTVADAEDLTRLVDAVGPDCIVNLVYARNLEIAEEMEVMCRGLWNTLEAARITGCPRVVLASSVRVYGPQSAHGRDVMLNEDSPCRPVVRYGYYKYLGEQLAADYTRQYGLAAVALRIAMVYGPGAREGAFGVNLPAIAAGGGQPVDLPYDPDARLCLAHVADVATALADLADRANADPRRAVYELGGHPLSYSEMVQIASEIVPDTRVSFTDHGGDRPERDVAYLLDGSRFAADYGTVHRPVRSGYESVVAHERAAGASR